MLKRWRHITKSEKGLTLIEVVISIAVLGIVAAAIVGYFQWSFGVFGYTDRRATAESVARSQMEHVKSAIFVPSGLYPTVVPPSGYTVVSSTSNVTGTDGMQKVVVTVTGPKQAYGPPVTVMLEGYKLDR